MNPPPPFGRIFRCYLRAVLTVLVIVLTTLAVLWDDPRLAQWLARHE